VNTTYSVTVTTSANCTWNDDVTVTVNPVPIVDAEITDASFPGSTDGAIQALITGGSPPYLAQWNTGDTSSSITGLSCGSYSITVEDLFGCEASGIFDVGCPNGIFEAGIKNGVRTFPNPVNEYVSIELNEIRYSAILIIDMTGKIVQENSIEDYFNDKSLKINVADLPPGKYGLMLLNEKRKTEGSGSFSIIR